MLPKNFDFAQLPEDQKDFSLKEIGMLGSRIEDIDYAMVSWLKEDPVHIKKMINKDPLIIYKKF